MTTKIEFGNILLVLNRKSLQVCPRGRFGRFLAKHLDIHFDPVPGDEGPKFTPHVTDPTIKGRGRRVFLPSVLSDDFARVMNAIGDDICEVWVAKSQHVELQVLQDAGCLVLVMTDAKLRSAVNAFKVREGVYRYKRSTATDVSFTLLDEAIEPLELERLPTKPRSPLAAIRVLDDDTLESVYLSYYPNGLYGPPGWYMTPMNWLGTDHEVIDEIMVRHLPSGFWAGMRMIARLLGLPFNDEKVTAALMRPRPES